MHEIRTEQQPDHHFRSEIPNIVYELGLSPIAFIIYSYLKRIAGDTGSCFKSIANLIKPMGISESSYKKYRKELTEKFDILGGLPLIRVEERKKKNGTNETTLITIVPIWRENGDYFRNLTENKKTSNGFSDDPGGGREKTPWGREKTTKKEPSNKNPSFKKDLVVTRPFQKKGGDLGASPLRDFSKEKSYVDCLNDEEREVHDMVTGHDPCTGKRFNSNDLCAWFKARSYTPSQVILAFEVYLQDEQAYLENELKHQAGEKQKPRDLGCMQAIMCKAIKDSRKPRSAGYEANKRLVRDLMKNPAWSNVLYMTERYVKIRSAHICEELPFTLPKSQFSSILRGYCERITRSY